MTSCRRCGSGRCVCSFRVSGDRKRGAESDANGTGKSARKVARRLVQIFKSTRLDGLTTDWECDKPALEPLNLKKDGKLARYLVGIR
jgi:hypothetical protein